LILTFPALDLASLLLLLLFDPGLTMGMVSRIQWGEKEYLALKALLMSQRLGFTGQKSWFVLDPEVADFGNW
jgi:hypothetical protein